MFHDPGDVDSPALSERDKAIRAYLIVLGKDLKQNGDLKKVLLDIVSSNLFIDPVSPNIKN